MDSVEISNVGETHDDSLELSSEGGVPVKTMKINEEVKIVEYAPGLFTSIREMDKISNLMILESLDTALNRKQVFKAKESAGRSGSFFFFSYDRRFLIKTMNDNEMKVFSELLSSYLMHLHEWP